VTGPTFGIVSAGDIARAHSLRAETFIGPVARALRAIQQYDELGDPGDHRLLLVQAMDALGQELGLRCTGTAEGDGFYDHGAETCPVHEWLVEADQLQTEEAR
jgi:hypothetical protein